MSAASWSAIRPSAWSRLEPRPTSSKIWLIRFSLDVGIEKRGSTALRAQLQITRFPVILIRRHVDVNYSLFSDTQQVTGGAEVPAAIYKRGTRQHRRAEPVDVQQLEIGRRTQHESLAVVVGEVDLPINDDR
jgi:hypothetical protein